MNALGWVWIGLALLNMRLARRRNRSGLNWLVVSLLIGPFATALLLVWPRVPTSGEAEVSSRQLAAGAGAALAGAIVCVLAAVGLGGGIPLMVLGCFFLVGAAVFVWLFLRDRPA